MRKVIITRFLPATTFKGARIKAKIIREEIIDSYNYGLSSGQNHIIMAYKLARKLDWKVKLASGAIENTTDCVHVIVEDCETWEEVEKFRDECIEKA